MDRSLRAGAPPPHPRRGRRPRTPFAALALMLAASSAFAAPAEDADLAARRASIEAALVSGDLGSALSLTRAARLRHPADPALLNRHAEALFALGRHDEVTALAPDLLARGSMLARELLLESATVAGEIETALAAARSLREEDPGNVGYGLSEAALLCDLGRLRESFRLLGELVERHPGCPGVHAALGILLERLGRPEEAARRFAHYLKLVPPEEREAAAADFARLRRAPARIGK